MQLIQIKRRKIQARQYNLVNEGKVKFRTERGYERPQDGDYIVDHNEYTIIIPKDAMEFLTTKDDDRSET